jgi:hypothetical protein
MMTALSGEEWRNYYGSALLTRKMQKTGDNRLSFKVPAVVSAFAFVPLGPDRGRQYWN